MKTVKCLFVFAAAFALSFSVFGKTGAEAAGGISSDPGTKKKRPDSASFEMAYYDKNEKTYMVTQFDVGEDVSWDDVLDIVQDININLTAVAADMMTALAKVAFLESMDEFIEARIDTLTETTRAAIESLDTLTLKDVDNQITKVLTKQPKADGGASGITYIGGGIFNVAGAQADGKSIASNSNDRLELKGFSDSTTTSMQIPCKGTQNLLWSNIGYWGDGKSIGEKDSGGNYLSFIKIAGWDNPGTGPHSCGTSIAAMLKRTESDPAPTPEQDPNNHLVLTRFNGGANPVMHFTPIGSLGAIGGGSAVKFFGTEGEAVVGSGSKTNTVTFAKFNDSNIRIKVESDNNGNATIRFGVYYQ